MRFIVRYRDKRTNCEKQFCGLATPVADDITWLNPPSLPPSSLSALDAFVISVATPSGHPPLLAGQLRSTLTLKALDEDGVCCEG